MDDILLGLKPGKTSTELIIANKVCLKIERQPVLSTNQNFTAADVVISPVIDENNHTGMDQDSLELIKNIQKEQSFIQSLTEMKNK